MEIEAMQEEIVKLDRRVTTLETERQTLLAQNKTIVDNTAELLATFNALKGAWVVLNFIGKLAKPVAAFTTLFGFVYWVKTGGNKP